MGDCELGSNVYRRRRRSISLCFPDAPQTEAVVGRIFPGLKLFGAFSLNWSVAVSAVVTPQFIGLQRVYLEPIGHSAQSSTIPTVTGPRSSATALRGAALPCRSHPSFFTLLLRMFCSRVYPNVGCNSVCRVPQRNQLDMLTATAHKTAK